GMLEEASDDRLRLDVFGQPLHARTQTADAPDDEVDGDACGAGLIEGVNDLRIGKRVALCPNRGWTASRRMLCFGFNMLEEPAFGCHRRDEQALEGGQNA